MYLYLLPVDDSFCYLLPDEGTFQFHISRLLQILPLVLTYFIMVEDIDRDSIFYGIGYLTRQCRYGIRYLTTLSRYSIRYLQILAKYDSF